MKRLLALLLLLTISSVLFAQMYRSNRLGQEIEAVDSLLSEGYCLSKEGDESLLYLDGKLVRSIVRSEKDGYVTVVETGVEDGSVATRQYLDGLLQVESTRSGDSETRVQYGYIDGHLAFCSTYINGDEKPSEMLFFLRSSSDGSLVAIKDEAGLRFLSDDYIYESGDLYRILFSDLVVKGDYELTEDGLVRYQQADGIYYYSQEGLLVRSEAEGGVTTYKYEEGVLSSSETVNGQKRVVDVYVDGKVTETSIFEGEVLSSVLTYMDGGNVQVLYKDGRKVATVYYNADNRTVNRIEYN